MHYLGWWGKRNIKRGEQREEEKLGSVLGTNRVRIKKYRETAAAVAGGGSVRFSRTSPRVLSREWLRRAWMAPPPCPCPPHFQHLPGSLLLLQGSPPEESLVSELWACACTHPLDPHARVSGFWQMPWGSIGRGRRRKRVSTEHLLVRGWDQSEAISPSVVFLQLKTSRWHAQCLCHCHVASKYWLFSSPCLYLPAVAPLFSLNHKVNEQCLKKNFINFLFTLSVGFLPGNYRIAYRSILYQEKVD